MPRFTLHLAAFTALIAFACQNQSHQSSSATSVDASGKQTFFATYGTPVLDGSASDDVWDRSDWLRLDQLWLGEKPASEDFSGQYKLAWDENNLYILAEITDDSLLDVYPPGLKQYWDDDCLEIFLDEDASGGKHQYNYNAFAYHIALDGQVSDIGQDSAIRFFDDHCLTRRINRGKVSTWEIAVRLYDGKQFKDGAENVPKLLKAGKKIGFALAYCDNDNSPIREHFIGNIDIPGADKNRAWIDADVFGLLELK